MLQDVHRLFTCVAVVLNVNGKLSGITHDTRTQGSRHKARDSIRMVNIYIDQSVSLVQVYQNDLSESMVSLMDVLASMYCMPRTSLDFCADM